MKKIAISLVIIVFIMFLFAFSSLAETVSDIKNMKDSIDNKINTLEAEKRKEKDALNNSVLNRKKLLDTLESYSKQKKLLAKDSQKKKDEIELLEDTVDEANEKYLESLEVLKSRIRSIYINSSKNYMDVLAQSNNLVEFSSRYYVLKNVARKNREIIEDYKTNKVDLEFKKVMQEMELAKLKSKIEEANKNINDISKNQRVIEQKIDISYDRLKKLEIQEDELLEESRKLSDKIKQFKSTTKKYVGGIMAWPAASSDIITSPFGYRFHPVLKTTRFHAGIDIGADMRTSILASNNGIVRLSGWEGGYGNTVIIDHGGGIVSLYGHCSSLLVKVGQSVKRGDTIAKIGSTGISTGPHLHFEVRMNGEPVDPMKYLGG